METTTPISPQPEIQDNPPASVSVPEKPKKKSFLIPLGIVILVLGLLVGIFTKQNFLNKDQGTIPTPSTPITPTTQQNQPLSAIATTSAFLSVQETIASLSASIQSFQVADTALNPPSLDLPLGLEIK